MAARGRPVLGKHAGPADWPRLIRTCAVSGTSVTEQELVAAATGGRTGPLPDLVTCYQQRPLVTDFRGASARGPSDPQLRLRLERLQAVRRAARQEAAPADPQDRSPPPPPGPDWQSSPRPRLPGEPAAEDADDEDSDDSEEWEERRRAQRRSSVGRELGAVADRLDAQHSLGTQTQLQTRNQVGHSHTQLWRTKRIRGKQVVNVLSTDCYKHT